MRTRNVSKAAARTLGVTLGLVAIAGVPALARGPESDASRDAELKARAASIASRAKELAAEARALAADAGTRSTSELRARAAALADAAASQARTLRDNVNRSIDDAIAAARRPEGVFLVRSENGSRPMLVPIEGQTLPPRMVVLIHGLDEAGGIWDDLAPALSRAGLGVAAIEYPNDQAIGLSANVLADGLAALRRAGVTRVDLVGYSMGGLVARDVLTRASLYAGKGSGHDRLPDVDRLFLLGTPNAGSGWARLEPLAEVIELVTRATHSGDPRQLMGFLTDGDGQAGRDLQPGSAYLRELATRPALTGVRVTAIVGRVAVEDLDWTALQARLAGVVGEAKAQELAARAMVGASLAADALGDGVVPVESARWAGASETVVVQAGHRGMVSSRSPDAWLAAMGVGLDTTPAIGVILDRLGVAAPRPGEDPAQ